MKWILCIMLCLAGVSATAAADQPERTTVEASALTADNPADNVPTDHLWIWEHEIGAVTNLVGLLQSPTELSLWQDTGGTAPECLLLTFSGEETLDGKQKIIVTKLPTMGFPAK